MIIWSVLLLLYHSYKKYVVTRLRISIQILKSKVHFPLFYFEVPSRFVSVLDKRRQENKQHDESVIEGKDNEEIEVDEEPADLKEREKGLSILR